MKTLYFGGPILTMDKTQKYTEALLCKDGKILALGAYEALRGDARETDLQGKALMPAFVDGHSHMLIVGRDIVKTCSLFGCTGFADMLERIKAFREERKLFGGEPIFCNGYDLAIMEEGKHPNAALLDSLGFDNPICCTHQSGHVAVYNTKAMEIAGVLEEGYVCPEGGVAQRDENGRLTGYFEENAKEPFNAIFNKDFTAEQMEKAILAAQEHYAKYGFATVQEGSANTAQRTQVFKKLAKEGKLKLDTVLYMGAGEEFAPLWESERERIGKPYENRLKIGGVKMFLDGSPQARTAWMLEPYEGEKEYRGYPTLSDEQVEQRLENAYKNGLQPLAHCNGSAACEQYLSAWEKLLEKHPDAKKLRPVMIHAQTVTYPQLERMKKAGMMPSFFIGHCFYWGDTHIKNFGERGYRISPLMQAQKRDMVFSLHQDSPITQPDMLHSIWCAVNRITRNGVVIGEDNRIDVYDALIAATNGGAYTYFEEETKGILKAGAVEDLVILDKDPVCIDPMEIKNIKVLETIKSGEAIYKAAE